MNNDEGCYNWHPAMQKVADAFEAEGKRVEFVPPNVRPGEGHTGGVMRITETGALKSAFVSLMEEYAYLDEYIQANKEFFCECWIAETGLLPSESQACTEQWEEQTPDGRFVARTKFWIERRKP